jgi:membrane protease subunit HflK
MAWNEPGRGNKDPWGSGGNGGNRGNGKGGGNPPDLDEMIRNLQRKLSGIFGGSGGGSGGGGSGAGKSGVMLVVLLLGLGWMASGLYQVDAAETGVVLRFGKLQKTAPPGLHWHIPWPVETVDKVNIAEIARFPYRTQMLTRDENIVAVDVTVQYRRNNPAAYLFNVRRAADTLCERLARELEDRAAGVVLRNVAGGWRLFTHPDTAPQVERFVLSSRQARLTKAALETLAIVAYKQPVTRHQIAVDYAAANPAPATVAGSR